MQGIDAQTNLNTEILHHTVTGGSYPIDLPLCSLVFVIARLLQEPTQCHTTTAAAAAAAVAPGSRQQKQAAAASRQESKTQAALVLVSSGAH